ncbi:MAG TPA: SDR family oxidoreductase [Pyrinomonadaceae bacterium]|nr:SDR family oxidoreductase [Pyrinomonadaceae bacterium]
MRALFIGGTGFISAAVSRQAVAAGVELYLLNRGTRGAAPPGAHALTADIHRPDEVRAALGGLRFDAVVDWVAFTPEDIERDISLFKEAGQYIFISSAAAYQKPPAHYVITEETPLENPFWDYARGKIACEERLTRAHAEEGFPATIVRPSHTYETNFPVAVGGGGTYTLATRMKKGLPVVVHGDGTSLWTVTHAEDFARGFLGLLGNAEAVGQAFHITSDEVLTWDEIYLSIAEGLGVEARIVHVPSDFISRVVPRLAGTLHGDKKWSAVFDNGKVKRFVPGFQATIPFREGIRRTIEWFESDERRGRVDESLNGETERILDAYEGRGG